MSYAEILGANGKILDSYIPQGGGVSLQKGQLITADASGTETAFPQVAPPNGSILSYDATQPLGLAYIAVPGATPLLQGQLLSANAAGASTIVQAPNLPAQANYVLTADGSVGAAGTNMLWKPTTGAGGIIDTNAPLVDDAGVGTNTISINFTAGPAGQIPYGNGTAKTGALTNTPTAGQVLGVSGGVPAWINPGGSGTVTALAPLTEYADGAASKVAIDFTAKGDLVVGAGPQVAGNPVAGVVLPVGADGTFLTARSSSNSGLQWFPHGSPNQILAMNGNADGFAWVNQSSGGGGVIVNRSSTGMTIAGPTKNTDSMICCFDLPGDAWHSVTDKEYPGLPSNANVAFIVKNLEFNFNVQGVSSVFFNFIGITVPLSSGGTCGALYGTPVNSNFYQLMYTGLSDDGNGYFNGLFYGGPGGGFLLYGRFDGITVGNSYTTPYQIGQLLEGLYCGVQCEPDLTVQGVYFVADFMSFTGQKYQGVQKASHPNQACITSILASLPVIIITGCFDTLLVDGAAPISGYNALLLFNGLNFESPGAYNFQFYDTPLTAGGTVAAKVNQSFLYTHPTEGVCAVFCGRGSRPSANDPTTTCYGCVHMFRLTAPLSWVTSVLLDGAYGSAPQDTKSNFESYSVGPSYQDGNTFNVNTNIGNPLKGAVFEFELFTTGETIPTEFVFNGSPAPTNQYGYLNCLTTGNVILQVAGSLQANDLFLGFDNSSSTPTVTLWYKNATTAANTWFALTTSNSINAGETMYGLRVESNTIYAGAINGLYFLDVQATPQCDFTLSAPNKFLNTSTTKYSIFRMLDYNTSQMFVSDTTGSNWIVTGSLAPNSSLIV